MIKKLRNQPYAPKVGARGRKKNDTVSTTSLKAGDLFSVK
jgi:hypothetical protein